MSEAALGRAGAGSAWGTKRRPRGGGGGRNKTQLLLDCPFPKQRLFLIYAFASRLKHAALRSDGRELAAALRTETGFLSLLAKVSCLDKPSWFSSSLSRGRRFYRQQFWGEIALGLRRTLRTRGNVLLRRSWAGAWPVMLARSNARRWSTASPHCLLLCLDKQHCGASAFPAAD